MFKKLYFDYFRKGLFYSGVFAGEYSKIFRYSNEVLLIYAVWKIKPVWWQIGLAMGIAMLISAVIGKLLVAVKVAKYDVSLGNQQNPEMIKIQADIDLIKERLGI